MNLDRAARAVRRALGRQVAGYCYVASEAVYHLAGGRKAGLVPMMLTTPSSRPIKAPRAFRASHWFLEHRPTKRRVDVTAGQFRPRLREDEYGLARGCGFLTKKPSLGAREIIAAVRREQRQPCTCQFGYTFRICEKHR